MNLREMYRVNRDEEQKLKKIRHFLLDMDGTVYYDETWIPGAREFLRRLEETGRHYCFMTNNSSKGMDQYIDKLHRMGLDINLKTQMVSSGAATIDYLKREYPGKKVFLFGNRVLKEEFEAEGICLEEEQPDLIVTAFAQEFHYRDLCKLCDLLAKGMPYIATHPDYVCPTKQYACGFMPDIGALQAYIKAATKRDPEVIIGKPEGEIIRYALKTMGATAEETAVVGDRLYTDVRSGVDHGLTGSFVMSGEGTLHDIETMGVTPTLTFDSVADMMELL